MFFKQIMRFCLFVIWILPFTSAFVACPSPTRFQGIRRQESISLQALPSNKMPNHKPAIAAIATALVPISAALAQDEQVTSAATTVDENIVLGLLLGLVGLVVSTVVGFALAYGALNKNDGRWGM